MDPEPETTVREFLERGRRAVWGLAALAALGSTARGDDLGMSAATLTGALRIANGIDLTAAEVWEARAMLAQAAGAACGPLAAWSAQNDVALRAQGEASAAMAAGFRDLVLPGLGGLEHRLDTPGARMLDVGTGVGALAAAFAAAFPHLEVTGIDVSDRPLALARDTLLRAGTAVADRVALHRADVAELDDADGFDLAWLPAPFVAEDALRTGIRRVTRSLRRGGWVMVAHARDDVDPVDRALDAFRTTAWGGTVITADGARSLLEQHAGLRGVRTVAMPPGAPAVTVATT